MREAGSQGSGAGRESVILYHYCCGHSVSKIRESMVLVPNRHPLLNEPPMIWLTDLPEPDVQGLGLTSRTLRCDRTEHRVTVDTDQAMHWPRYARRVGRRVRDEFEIGRLPMHWWLSETELPVVEIR